MTVKGRPERRAPHKGLVKVERLLAQVETAKDGKEIRAGLGSLLFDLVALEKRQAIREMSENEQDRLDVVKQRAWELQRQIQVAGTGRGGQSGADSAIAYWLSKGFTKRGAAALAGAGLRTLEEAAAAGIEQLEVLRGVGWEGIRLCEELLGRPLVHRAQYWTLRGLPGRTAGYLIRAGIATLEDLGRMTKADFLSHRGLGETALRQCEAVLGRPLASPEDAWLAAGCPRWLLARRLVQAGILTVEDLRRWSRQDLVEAGFKESEIAQCNQLKRAGRR